MSPEKSIRIESDVEQPALAPTRNQTEISTTNNKSLDYMTMSEADQLKLAIDILERLNLHKYVNNFREHEVTIKLLVSKNYNIVELFLPIK